MLLILILNSIVDFFVLTFMVYWASSQILNSRLVSQEIFIEVILDFCYFCFDFYGDGGVFIVVIVIVVGFILFYYFVNMF